MAFLTRPATTLRWRLTAAYTLVTVGALLVLELMTLLVLASWTFMQVLTAAPEVATQLGARAAPFLAAEPPDVAGLDTFLNTLDPRVFGEAGEAVLEVARDPRSGGLSITGPDGEVLAVAGATFKHTYSPATNGRGTALRLAPLRLVVSAPISNAAGLRGAVVLELKTTLQTLLGSARLALLVGVSAGVVTLFALPVGALFGFLSARWLTRRLERLERVSEAWSRGEFALRARDMGADEIGQLARRLNLMAGDLETLLHIRQDLARLQERNRLALELHDSVKQQVFAGAMQVGAAKTLLTQAPDAAARHMDEVEQLLQHALHELTGLIHALRPAQLEGRSFGEALRALLVAWSRQTGVTAHLTADAHLQLEPALEQTLFRVAQEALANVAKHSDASQVTVSLSVTADTVRLNVDDDGCGFDAETAPSIGLGLQSMRERLEHVGGTLSVDSKAGSGTRVSAELKTHMVVEGVGA